MLRSQKRTVVSPEPLARYLWRKRCCLTPAVGTRGRAHPETLPVSAVFQLSSGNRIWYWTFLSPQNRRSTAWMRSGRRPRGPFLFSSFLKRTAIAVTRGKASRHPQRAVRSKETQFLPAGVAHWVGCHPTNREVTGLTPGQGTCLGWGPGPLVAGVREATHRCFSPSFPLSLNRNT